jgi:hypothetical protein
VKIKDEWIVAYTQTGRDSGPFVYGSVSTKPCMCHEGDWAFVKRWAHLRGFVAKQPARTVPQAQVKGNFRTSIFILVRALGIFEVQFPLGSKLKRLLSGTINFREPLDKVRVLMSWGKIIQ